MKKKKCPICKKCLPVGCGVGIYRSESGKILRQYRCRQQSIGEYFEIELKSVSERFIWDVAYRSKKRDVRR